jgi:hypothetical protein
LASLETRQSPQGRGQTAKGKLGAIPLWVPGQGNTLGYRQAPLAAHVSLALANFVFIEKQKDIKFGYLLDNF